MTRTFQSATSYILFAALLIQIPVCKAQKPSIWEPSTLTNPSDDVPKGSVSADLVTRLRISDLDIVLEETKMSAVQKHLGGTVGHRGDAGDSLYWLCYKILSPQRPTVLWLMSGEIDDGDVSGFEWLQIEPTAHVDQRCHTLDSDTVKLPIPIRVGSTEAAVTRSLGKPTRKRGNHLEYVHEHEQQIHNEQYFETNTVDVLLRNGIVWAIQVWKSTTS